jgi:flagellar FliL protein
MATKKIEAEAEEKPKSASGKKGKLLKIMLALVLLAGGGGGAWWYMTQQKTADQDAVAPQEKPATFVNLDPFTVNLRPEAEDQYLQVGLTLKVTEAGTTDAIKLHMPEIRNKILLLLGDKKASEISTSEGKQQLSTELLDAIRLSISITAPKAQQEITDVLFTSFVIQ